MNIDNEFSATPAVEKNTMRDGKPSGRRFPYFWLLLAVVVFVQWPMFKGLFYKVSGVAAPASTIPWRSDFEAATAEAKASGKPLLVVFSAAWCPPCIVMKHDTWPDPDVAEAVTAAFVPVYIDVDDPTQATTASRFEVSGIPAVMIVDSDGKILKQEAFLSRSETLAFLQSEAS